MTILKTKEWGRFFVIRNSDSKRRKTDKFDIKIESFCISKKTHIKSKIKDKLKKKKENIPAT